MFLITLARFVDNDEKLNIISELNKKGFKAKQDLWSSKSIICDKLPSNEAYFANIIELKEEFSPETLTDLISVLAKYKIKKIKAKIGNNVPFHEMAIIQRFKRKNKFDETGNVVYVEARNIYKLEVRVGILLENQIVEHKYNDLAIESPKTVGEISDFVRTSKVLGNKVYIITLNDRVCLQAIDAFKRENIFDKANVEIIDSVDKIKDKYTLVSFSLWGKNTLSNLKQNSNENYLFLFGNEERGLLKSTMDKSKFVIKIGNKSSEPLRATQAALFALGYLYKQN